MTELRFTIPGPPVPKGRPRFRIITVRGRSTGSPYTPAETVEAERMVRLAARKIKPRNPLVGPLRVEIVFVFPRPEYHRKLKALPTWHDKQLNDVDNCAKLVFDALNGVTWVDDGQIADMRATKIYGDDPRTEVIIRTLTEDDAPGVEASLSLFKS